MAMDILNNHNLVLAIETASHTFNKMQEDGLISVKGRQIKILNMARLSTMAHAPSHAKLKA
jgi:CRP/FNR family transcriptional regulator, anaerobic regulatory protein